MILRLTCTPLLVLIALFLVINCSSSLAQNVNPIYDKALADSLGADEYGMKMYMLVILKSGTNATPEKSFSDSVFNGHMQNINRLVQDGKLIVAGPLQKNDRQYRGIFILNVKTKEEAQALLVTDPAINSKVLDTEIYGWYGSAALPMYLPASEKVEKIRY